MTKAKSKAGIGSSFDDFLKQEGIQENAQELATLRVFAWKIKEPMKAKSITKVEMARRMNTSRNQIDRLLDPTTDHVELSTLARAANAVGHRLHLDLVA
jgi:antitoxin HicB